MLNFKDLHVRYQKSKRKKEGREEKKGRKIVIDRKEDCDNLERRKGHDRIEKRKGKTQG